MTKSDRFASVADLETARAERPQPPEPPRAAQIERVPAVSNAATAANTIYMDGCLAFSYGQGIGSLTLTASRQLTDTAGQLYEDHVIVGLLRASMPALRYLRACINEIENLEARHAAATVAAMERPTGTLPN